MVTLAKLCLVMTVVLGLAFASPHPTWSRNQDTGDKVFKVGVSVRIPNALSSSGDLQNEGEKPGFSPRIPELSCPEKDYILYIDGDIKVEAGIESWSDCGKMCIMLYQDLNNTNVVNTCEYWTWDQAGQKCFLKSDYTGGFIMDGHYSGKRGCE